MDIDLLSIPQDSFSTSFQQRNHNSKSNKDILIKESNIICHSIITYQFIKLVLFLAYYQETLESPLCNAAYLIFIHDVITLLFYMILDALTFKFTYEELFKEDQILNIFELNHSLIFLILQEVFSSYRPLNGIVLLYKIQQKWFKYPLIIVRILYYFTSVYYLVQWLNSSQENNLLIRQQLIELMILWFTTLTIMILIGIIIVINITLRKQIRFTFQNKLQQSISNQLTEIKFQEVIQSFQGQNINCPICYEQINEFDTIIQLPCHQKHLFHSKCCNQWLFQDLRCPLCRNELLCKKQYSIKVSCF
ncbi:unnamed protein product [Paramecium primaurelia]|uniref:RING-type domain-containing protein n=1 Tax=Paramecium primaurelia TaxID=5886 RepID=A0A8S1M2P6_PARPR|nr:unnamed protein product [Paramecium primaurelia]